MSPLFIAIGSWVLLILVVEGFLWLLFRRKFIQICLPKQGDVFFHFFTVGRLFLFVLMHTLILIALVIIGHLLLWP